MARVEDMRRPIVGGAVPIPERELQSPATYKKVRNYLRVADASRTLRLIEISSGTRQIVNGIIENYILRLRKAGTNKINVYRLYVYTKAGAFYATEVNLIPLGIVPF